MDNSLITLYTLKESFEISLSIDNYGILDGKTSIFSVEGSASFNFLVIKSTGIFIITASGYDMIEAKSNQFVITAPNLGRIEINPNTTLLSPFFTLALRFTLYSTGNYIWKVASTININPSLYLGGDLSVSTSNGTCFAYVYGLKSGNLLITAKAGSVSESIRISFVSNILKITILSNDVISN